MDRQTARHGIHLRTAGVALFLLLSAVAARDACDCDNATDHWVSGASNFWHGTLGRSDFCNNASIGPDRQKAADCAWTFTVAQFGPPPDVPCARQSMENSPQGRADLDEFVRIWTTATVADCSSPASVNAFFPYWHGALGKADYCNNAAIGADREKAKDCAFRALVRDKGVAPTSCLRDAIANSPQGSADLDEFVRIWTAATVADCSSPVSVAGFFPYWHGALGKADYCNNAAIGPDREKAKECAFQALVRDKGVAPTSCLRDAIADSPDGRADLDEFVRIWSAKTGTDCSSPATVSAFFPHWHGALGKADYCNNAAVGADREEAKECAFQALVRDDGVPPTSCLRDAIATSPQGSADLDEFVRKWTNLQNTLPKGTVAADQQSVTPTDSESCDPARTLADYYIPPTTVLDWTPTVPVEFKIKADITLPGNILFDPTQNFTNIFGANEGRLRPELRAAARRADPLFSLCESAKAFADGDSVLGNAFADLSVTGRASFARFRKNPPDESHVRECGGTAAVKMALNRAYTVANVIRFGNSPERHALGWIAVSGEDDQPYRPVNVPSAEFPQFDLAVTVPVRAYNSGALPPITVNTRYMIAYPPPDGLARPKHSSDRRLLPDPEPVLPNDAEVILYIHGMDSRLEEALDLTHALHRIAGQRGKKYTVISMDLPTSGYASNIDHVRISPLETVGTAKFRPVGAGDLELTDAQIFDAGPTNNAPVLDFIEDFIVAFVETLDAKVPGVKQQLRAIVGGSLGGNMAMRLGRRTDKAWIRNVVPWSPAAIWPSFAADVDPSAEALAIGLISGAVVTNPGAGAATVVLGAEARTAANHIAVAVPWLWAGGDPRMVPESPVMRRLFFYYAFDWRMGILGGKPQAEAWYRDGWPCKAAHMFAARLDRYETYDPKFRMWHWRLAAEQLLFSQQLVAHDTRRPLYMENKTRMLLACGYDDTGGNLCAYTRYVAWKMTLTPGKAIFLHNTGHSIHNERPNWLARNIADFLEGSP